MKRTAKQRAEAILRKDKRGDKADAMFVVRGRIDQEGNWGIDWEAMHWLQGADPSWITPSGLPQGFASAAAQQLASLAATDVFESHAGRMVANLGETLGKSILESLRKKPE